MQKISLRAQQHQKQCSSCRQVRSGAVLLKASNSNALATKSLYVNIVFNIIYSYVNLNMNINFFIDNLNINLLYYIVYNINVNIKLKLFLVLYINI